MIGLLDLAGQRLVRTALERSGWSLCDLRNIDDALQEAASGRIESLIVETVEVDAVTHELLSSMRGRSIPVLVVARDRTVSAGVEALRAGATDYLCAPFEYDSLLGALERLGDLSSAGAVSVEAGDELVTQDPDSQATVALVRSVAPSNATILIEGESGTGKELLARLVHASSTRRHRELISVNCAALPPGLLESELFGHERGAFTGAFTRVIGKFELAHGTTILLDEIGELELSLQAKLLRVIQERQVQRVGARRPIDVDFRLVATTNRKLSAEVSAGRFREDLFYRLNVLPVRLSPLRERPCDVPLLLRHFLAQHLKTGARPLRFPEETLAVLLRHDWPGNARELENLIERLVLTHPGREIRPEDLGLPDRTRAVERPRTEAERPFRTIREMERWLIVETLGGLQGNRTQAARELGISLRTLRNKINEYEVVEPETLPRSGSTVTGSPRGRRQISPSAV